MRDPPVTVFMIHFIAGSCRAFPRRESFDGIGLVTF